MSAFPFFLLAVLMFRLMFHVFIDIDVLNYLLRGQLHKNVSYQVVNCEISSVIFIKTTSCSGLQNFL